MKHINESMNHTTGAIFRCYSLSAKCSHVLHNCDGEDLRTSQHFYLCGDFDCLVPKRMKMPGYEYEASRCTQCSLIHDNRALITIFEGRAVHHSACKAIYSDRMRRRRAEQPRCQRRTRKGRSSLCGQSFSRPSQLYIKITADYSAAVMSDLQSLSTFARRCQLSMASSVFSNLHQPVHLHLKS